MAVAVVIFGKDLVDIPHGRHARGRRDAHRRHTHQGGLVGFRRNDDFRTRQIIGRTDVGQFLQARHFALQFNTRALKGIGVLTHENIGHTGPAATILTEARAHAGIGLQGL